VSGATSAENGECLCWRSAVEEKKKKIYLCGMITGDPNYMEKFAAAERMLRAEGYIILNPTILPQELAYSEYFPPRFGMIEISDDLFMFLDWIKSRGAKNEYFRALSQEKGFRFEKEGELEKWKN